MGPLAGGSAPEGHRCATSPTIARVAWIQRRARAFPPEKPRLLLSMITVNAWLKGVDAWLPAVTPDADGVRVSTIHAARGLEADGVLLLDAHHLQTRAHAEAAAVHRHDAGPA